MLRGAICVPFKRPSMRTRMSMLKAARRSQSKQTTCRKSFKYCERNEARCSQMVQKNYETREYWLGGSQRKRRFCEDKRQLDENIKRFYDRKKKFSTESRYRFRGLCKLFLCVHRMSSSLRFHSALASQARAILNVFRALSRLEITQFLWAVKMRIKIRISRL